MKTKQSVEYRAWLDAIYRCYKESTPSYKNYGGKGIKVCGCIKDNPEAFLSYMGKRPSSLHSLDRKDSKKDYCICKHNLKWSSKEDQQLNRMHKNNGSSKHRGVTWNKLAKKWASQLRFRGTRYFLGYFDKEEDAAWEYLKKYNEIHNCLPPEYKGADSETATLISYSQ